MKKTLLLLLLSLTLFASCKRDAVENPVIDTTDTEEERLSFSVENREMRPTVLGERKNNPYSVENMRIALDSLRAYARVVGDDEMSSSAGIRTKSLEAVNIGTTDLYVRFLPRDTASFLALRRDTMLELFDRPLDYEIVQSGDYYRDPTVADNAFTWQYAVVKPGYDPPQGVEYEILSELFIIENSPGYTEEAIDEDAPTTRSGGAAHGVIDGNLRKALTATSFMLTGNGDELQGANPQMPDRSPLTRATVKNCRRYCLFWGRFCWTSCDYKYYPDGYIRLNTPSGIVPLKGVKVRMSRWFHVITAYTDKDGHYQCTGDYYDDILVMNCPSYEINFEGKNGNNSWTLSKTIAQAVCLWTDYYGAGRHSPNGHSMTFYTNSDYWGRCVLQNAFYDYMTYARLDDISLPPANLDVANSHSNDILPASAPLLKNHINTALILDSPFWGLVATAFGYQFFGWAMPDIILKRNKNISDYEKMTSTVWHELTHAGMFRRMVNEKGFNRASTYWSYLVLNEVRNNDANYGGKGVSGWQQIALAEGWANYREWELARRYLNWNSLSKMNYTKELLPTTPMTIKNDFARYPRNYSALFYELRAIGCSFSRLEKSLCAYTLAEFRDNLIAEYPYWETKIINIVKDYE